MTDKVNEIPEELKGVDVEPLFILYRDEEWINPFVESWYHPHDVLGFDPELHNIVFSKGDDKVSFYFSSNYVTNNYIRYVKDEAKTYHPDYVNVFIVASYITDGVMSDAYIPSPMPDREIKTPQDYIKFRMEYPSQKFIDSDFFKSLPKLDESWDIEHFQPLAGFAKRSDQEGYVLNCAV